MREHQINCQIEGDKSQCDIQRTINIYTTLHITEMLKNSGLARESQIQLLSRMIEELKK